MRMRLCQLQQPVFQCHQDRFQDIRTNRCSSVQVPEPPITPLFPRCSIRECQRYIEVGLAILRLHYALCIPLRTMVEYFNDEGKPLTGVMAKEREKRTVVCTRR